MSHGPTSSQHPMPKSLPRDTSRAWWLTLPNLITLSRILLIPIMVVLWFHPWGWDQGRWICLALFSVAAISDLVDGYLARKFGDETPLGAMLDPIADKLLFSSTALLLATSGVFHVWEIIAVLLIIGREFLVSGLREYLGKKNVKLASTFAAKAKTVVQLVGMGFFIPVTQGWLNDVVSIIAPTILWLSCALTLWTGGQYFAASRHHLRASSVSEPK